MRLALLAQPSCGLVLFATLLTACAGASNDSSSTGGTAGEVGTLPDGGFDNAPSRDDDERVDGGTGGAGGWGDVSVTACAGRTQRAEPIEVDMFVMLDRSGSMNALTGAGESKWDAIRSALTAFVQDEASEGLGVGLQYFPLARDGVPETCMADGECGSEGGVCLNRACLPPNNSAPFTFALCRNDDDCPAVSPGCVPFGLCSLDPTFACFDVGAGACDVQGDCDSVPGECERYASCDGDVYETPAVPIATLPDNAMALVASLMDQTTAGLTPTRPALTGAVQRAAEHAASEPSRRSIAVLATDGLPTECSSQSAATLSDAVEEVAQVAGAALGGTPSVRTYVIGVFAPDEVDAPANLDRMASAGGTERAFVVDASADVAAQFLEALAQIRAGTLQCELRMPEAPEDSALDYGQVNVELTANDEPSTMRYVRDATGCGQAELGWYYDVDPAQGGTPTTIRICEQTCDMLQALGRNATLEVRLGCATLGPD